MERSTREMTYNMQLRKIDVSKKGFEVRRSSTNGDHLRKHISLKKFVTLHLKDII